VKYFLIMVIIIVLFGGARLPGLARGLGAGIRNFKDGLKGDGAGNAESDQPEKPKSS
jgi:sec-independent protein translocase protein TatA